MPGRKGNDSGFEGIGVVYSWAAMSGILLWYASLLVCVLLNNALLLP